jgi:hypothetical protein
MKLLERHLVWNKSGLKWFVRHWSLSTVEAQVCQILTQRDGLVRFIFREDTPQLQSLSFSQHQSLPLDKLRDHLQPAGQILNRNH